MTPLRETLRKIYLESDEEFKKLFPMHIQASAEENWTPGNTARKAAAFLAEKVGVRILDIGSGIGKFCLTAGWRTPNVVYVGVEPKRELFDWSVKAKHLLRVENVTFLHGSFMDVDLHQFNHFYLFNPFSNGMALNRIGDDPAHTQELNGYYSENLCKRLDQLPVDTRICTLGSYFGLIPQSFVLVNANPVRQLQFWIKVR